MAGKLGMSIEDYLVKNPDVKPLNVEKQTGLTQDPTVSQQDMGSESDDGSSDSVSWFDQTWFGRGFKAASTTGEALDLYREGSNVNLETVQEFIKAKEQEASTYVPSERMQKFQKLYNKEGKTWTAFFRGVAKDPALLPELFVQSLGTQIGTAFDAPEARAAAAAGAGVGAGAGSFVPGFGTVAGGLAGAMGGLASGMETALTFGELIEKELKKQGKEFTDVNVKELLEGPMGKTIRNRAIGRGLTIGAIETLSGGLAGKATIGTSKALVKAGKTAKSARVAGAGVGVGVEAVGGGTGEVLGRVAADQEMDAAEIGFEAFTGISSAPVNVGFALLNNKAPKYTLNKKDVTYAEMKDFIDTADDIDIATADIKMENDFTGLGETATEKQNNAILDSQIDETVTDVTDRSALIDLQKQKIDKEQEANKKGIEKVPNAEQQLADINAQIDAIINKYEGAVGIGQTDVAQKVAKTRRDISVSDTIEFAESAGKLIGKDVKVVDDTKSAVNLAKKLGVKEDVSKADGFIAGDSIVINKDIAGRTGAISVGSHEVLHGVLNKHLKNIGVDGRKKLIADFKRVITPDQLKAVNKRLQENYQDQIKKDSSFLETTDEWFTAFSDAIAKNEITFNETTFDKIKNFIQEVLRRFGIKKDFANGRQAYNFLKEYDKNIKSGKLGSRAIALAEGGTTADFAASRSEAVAAVNKIEQDIKNTFQERNQEFTKENLQTSREFNKIFETIQPNGAISNYIKSLPMSPEKKQETIQAVTDRLINYNPKAQRKTGGTEPITLGEFMMANVGFGKLDAAKSLAIKTQEDKTKVDLDKAKGIADTDTKSQQPIKKDVKLRKLSDFNIKLEDGVVDAEIIAQTEDIAKNLNEGKINVDQARVQLESLVNNEFRKLLDDNLGKIQRKEGKGFASPEFQKFISDEFIEIVNSLGIETIRTAYKPFFDKTKTGVKNYKNVDQETGKVSNYVKDTQVNKANKPKFIKYFTEGSYTTLRERRSALIKRVAKRKSDNAINRFLENQELEADVAASLQSLTDRSTLEQSELASFDAVKYSFTKAKKFAEKFGYEFFNPSQDTNSFDTLVNELRILSAYMPGLIRRVDLYNYGISNKKIKEYARETTLEYGDAFVIGKKSKIKSVEAYVRPDNALGKRMKDITKDKVDRYNKIGRDNFNKMWDGINKALKANPKNKKLPVAIFYYLSSSINDTSHPNRTGAVYVGGDITNTGEIIYEHALQSVNVFNQLLEAIVDSKQDFKARFKATKDNYFLIGMKKSDAKAIDQTSYIDENGNTANYKTGMGVVNGKNWDVFTNKWFERYFNEDIFNNPLVKINPKNFIVIKNGKTFAQEYGIGGFNLNKNNNQVKTLSKAVLMSRTSKPSKGISILDFDDTLATTESLVKYTTPSGVVGTLNAEQFASTYQDLQELGYKFDFSDFNKVVKGKLAPLFNKALKLQNKFGSENMFVLTARPAAAQKPIFDFLKANGLNIPLKNITGLGNSTSEAKALWVADKVSQGFNDFYFADDALQNVQAVKNVLDQFDVKSKVQQAKVKFSKTLSDDFNNILEDISGIEAKKRYSASKAKKRGQDKGRFRFFIPPSHEDFAGLLYNFMGSGRKGNQHMQFFENALIRPLNRSYRELNAAKQAIANDYNALMKRYPDMRKRLTQRTPDGDYLISDAVRVYLWNKLGFDVPGMTKTDKAELAAFVQKDTDLASFANEISAISRVDEGYVKPGDSWEAGDIRTDLADATGRVGREKYFNEFNENADIIFSKENLNKIEAQYGSNFREALEDVLYRTRTGSNRPTGKNRLVNRFLDYINGSVGAVMFFNARSAVLQHLSTVNFLNFGDNNIFKASAAFANQQQFWQDYAMIFNSDYLKQRRAGRSFDVNANEIASAVANSKQPVRAAIKHLLNLGFLPTQLSDSNAIALGGATFYRNRVETYEKQGLSKAEAESKAFIDFQEIAEATQQSARPDMISQQQASPLGRLILAFQNVTAQYTRIIKKAGLDLVNRRKVRGYKTQWQSDMSNLSRIIYYAGIQNVVFYGLQSAMFAMMFDDDEQDKEFFDKKRDRIINGSIDSILRGSGVGGAVISTIKNAAIKMHEQNQKKDFLKEDNALMMELLQLSPPIGIKARKLQSAEKTLKYNAKEIENMSLLDIENPVYEAGASATEALTNVPVSRLYNKTRNVSDAMNSEFEWWQRLAMGLGWSRWNLGVTEEEIKQEKQNVRTRSRSTQRTRGKRSRK